MAYSNNRSTFFCPAGTKWYWEFVPTTTYNYAACGITTISHEWDINPGGGNSTPSGHGVGFYGVEVDVDGSRTNPAGNSAWASGDIIGFAYDVDANTIKKYINGSLDFTYSSVPVSTDGDYSPSFGDFGGAAAATINVNFGQDSSFAGLKTAQGNQDSNEIGDFYYEPPTDYLALCSSNLPSPEIALPTDHFNTLLFVGDGASSRAVTGVGFAPDWSWLKNRDTASNHFLMDSVRGDGLNIKSSSSDAEWTHSTMLKTLDSDGFTVGSGDVNQNTKNIVAWNWKAGGAAVSNTDGTVTSSVSANTTAGFSIMSYAGTGAAMTVGHGLSVAPQLTIIKDRDAAVNWIAYTNVVDGSLDYLFLNTTAAAGDSGLTGPNSSIWNMQAASSYSNTSGRNYIAYCFHSVEGYSKVGSYEGNGNADGTFVYTGFQPAFWFVKSIDTAYHWYINDLVRNPYNVSGYELYPSSSGAEASATRLDLVSNGFKARGTQVSGNASGVTYLYYAVAESPFKTSNAR